MGMPAPQHVWFGFDSGGECRRRPEREADHDDHHSAQRREFDGQRDIGELALEEV